MVFKSIYSSISQLNLDLHVFYLPPSPQTHSSSIMSDKVDAPTSSSTETSAVSNNGAGAAKAVIKNVDMSDELQQEAVDVASSALEKYNIEKDIAAQIKKEFDKRHGPTWHVVVGKNFGSYVTHGAFFPPFSLIPLLLSVVAFVVSCW